MSKTIDSIRNRNCFQIKQLLAIQYFNKQTLVSLDSSLLKEAKRGEEKGKEDEFTKDCYHSDSFEEEGNQQIRRKGEYSRKVKNISPFDTDED